MPPGADPAPSLADKAAVQEAVRALSDDIQDAIDELSEDPPALAQVHSQNPRVV